MTQMLTPFIALLALLLAPNVGLAQQTYPTKPVTLMTTFAPGGSSDLIARLVAQKLTEQWKKQVIVDNRPGGAGFIAMQAAARAAPDGHTLVLGHIGVLAVNPAMFPTLPYDPIKDYAPISLVATVPTVLAVHPSVPAQSLKELIALTKSKPGTYFYGTAGNGSAAHLATEYLKQQTGIDATHVPYKSVVDLHWPSYASMGVGQAPCNLRKILHWTSCAFIAIYTHGRDSPGTVGGWHG